MVYSGFEKEKKSLTSDFNEAKLQIFRLNNALERCNKHAREGDLISWKWELDGIFRELSTDAEYLDSFAKETQKYGYKINKINQLISKYDKNAALLYKILEKKEIILRRLQDEAGKGSKRSDIDAEDIDL